MLAVEPKQLAESMSSSPYIVGIDLGTTNCALAFAEPARGAEAPVTDFQIPQLQRPGEVASQPLLPSCLYLPGEHELPAGSTRLPWEVGAPASATDSPAMSRGGPHPCRPVSAASVPCVPEPAAGMPPSLAGTDARLHIPGSASESSGLIAGEFARWQGARVPGRLVASAKSWLCHAGVDRVAPILPWGAPAEVAKISPVDASARLLAHLTAAWNHAHPDAPLADQEVVITVPASFDEVARALTVTAAQRAGLSKFTLVEEPQAAFYAFTARHRDTLAPALGDARLVLVVDVGGGTTDFTLIQVAVSPEGPVLQRLAVGEHLMLGGDNMDAALARLAEERMLSGGRRLSAAQWTQLLQTARAAKESLLGRAAPARHGLALAGEGSRLLGATLSAELQRDETERLILDGFFPGCGPGDAPQRAARVALQELGLPYAQDPAITRHLAAFLRQHAKASFAALAEGSPTAQEGLPRPDAILLNGGVFNSPQIVERLLAVVSNWWPTAPPIRLLPHDSLELAVARGAAGYGLVRRGLGRRITGGAAHAFYVGLAAETATAAMRAVCLIPRGHEEGETVELIAQPFSLTLGRAVQFPLFTTTADRVDRPGEVVEIDDDFRALPPIHTLFKPADSRAITVPVHLRATLTELGTLELWCVANVGDERWRLEFELRGATVGTAPAVTESMPARWAEARALVERLYGRKSGATTAKEVKQLARQLEATLGPRERWRLPLLREIWSSLYAGAARRRRSADHERVYCQLLGYSLRPGFGYPLDEWRCAQTFELFAGSVTFHTEAPVWSEFWVLWRRIAGGLTAAHQQTLWSYLQPHLARRIPVTPPAALAKPKGVQPEGLDEMVRVAASLEHLDPADKVLLGNWIAGRLKSATGTSDLWAWALGRLGARVPLYGSSHKTVDPRQAAAWLTLLLDLGLRAADGTAFAAVQLARLTGDRARDLEQEIRTRTVIALEAASTPPHWRQMLVEAVALEDADEVRALGDTLPVGLRLPGNG